MPHFLSPTLVAIPFFLLTFTLEWWAVKKGLARGRYETKDALASIAMGLGNVGVDLIVGALGFTGLMFAWEWRLYELPVTWWSIALAFVAYDFVYYWKHRFMHRVRWFWMEHVTHHSSTHYNLTTALRQPWFGPFTGLFLVSAPLVMLGFHPAVLAFAGGLNLVYQYWIHTEAIGRMPGWFEAVMNTPSHHRVHHAINPRYLDANYAGVFIIWDRMFGTYVREGDEPIEYGIVKPLGSYNPVIIAYHEFAGLIRDCASDGFRPWRWIGRAINPPGWSPDGRHNRSEEIKRAWMTEHPDQAHLPGLPREKPRPASVAGAHADA